jgi:hypothetical protein
VYYRDESSQGRAFKFLQRVPIFLYSRQESGALSAVNPARRAEESLLRPIDGLGFAINEYVI